jgi:hypothetical protein
MKSLKLPLYLAGFLLMPAFLTAQTTFLSVDFNQGTTSQSLTQSGFTNLGAPTVATAGPFTTSFTGLDVAYTSGTVGLTMTFPGGNYLSRDRTTNTPVDTGSFTYANLYRDIWNPSSANGGNLIYSFSGLLANTSYQLRFYTYDAAASSSRTMTFTDWTSGSQGTGSATGSVTYTGSYVFTGAAGDNYLYSTLITATSSATGTLEIRETTGGSYASIINGFEISAAIPEPSTYAAIFGTLALAGAVAFRRHRQNN